nr:DNA helicase [Tanacetum cinerariifolium]
EAASWDLGKRTWGGRERGFGTVPVLAGVQEEALIHIHFGCFSWFFHLVVKEEAQWFHFVVSVYIHMKGKEVVQPNISGSKHSETNHSLFFLRQEMLIRGRWLPILNRYLHMVAILIRKAYLSSHVGQLSGQRNARPHSNAALKASEVPADSSVRQSSPDLSQRADGGSFVDSDVFNRYHQLCARNVKPRWSPSSSQLTDGAVVCSSVGNTQAINNESTTSTPLILEDSTCEEATYLRGDNVNTVENTPSIHNELTNSVFPTTEDFGYAATLVSTQRKRTRENVQAISVTSENASLKRIRTSATTVGNKRPRRAACGNGGRLQDKCRKIDILEFKIRLYNAEGARGYELLTSNTLGAIVFDSGHLGFRTKLKLRSADGSGDAKRVTMLAFYAYQLHRVNEYNLIFRGGLRYMYAHYLDALAICRKLGNPQCCLLVFEQNIKPFVAFTKKERTFGDVIGVLYTVEFETRAARSTCRPHGYKIVSEMMVYGPCGATNMSAPFVWYYDRKSWSPRWNSRSSIGRLAYVHPTSGELFYFRMLLCHQMGCRDFLEVQTINKKFYPTCQATCEAMGLLGDDKEWDISIQDACVFATKSLQHFGLPAPPAGLLTQLANRLLMEERNYNREELMQERHDLVRKLNDEQRKIYDLIIHADATNQQELIFVYGHGGNGKTFLWKTIISTLRFKGKIMLAVASSEESLCRITKNTHLGKLLADTALIIWDEAPMNDRRCFEALDRSLRDILTSPRSLFGGSPTLSAKLPVVINKLSKIKQVTGRIKIPKPDEKSKNEKSKMQYPVLTALFSSDPSSNPQVQEKNTSIIK